MHKVTKHQMRDTEPEQMTPCFQGDPERWFPEGQLPDAEAAADCWSCFYQSRCALRALTLDPQPEHGVWGGYRLAPGPGLKRNRKELRIIDGLDVGPARSPGAEVAQVLSRRAAGGACCESAGDAQGMQDVDAPEPAGDGSSSDEVGAEVIELADYTPTRAAAETQLVLPLTLAMSAHAPTG